MPNNIDRSEPRLDNSYYGARELAKQIAFQSGHSCITTGDLLLAAVFQEAQERDGNPSFSTGVEEILGTSYEELEEQAKQVKRSTELSGNFPYVMEAGLPSEYSANAADAIALAESTRRGRLPGRDRKTVTHLDIVRALLSQNAQTDAKNILRKAHVNIDSALRRAVRTADLLQTMPGKLLYAFGSPRPRSG